MEAAVNVPLAEMRALLSHDRKVAFPFYRNDRMVRVFQFAPQGPVIRDYPLDTFKHAFTVPVDKPAQDVVLKLIGASRTCYLPGSRVMTTLLEILTMTATNGTNDLESLTQSELTETYNKLAEAAGKPTVKGFKDKALAVSRIKALQADVAKPTPSQAKAAEAAAHDEDNAFNKSLAAKRAAKKAGAAPKAAAAPKPAAKRDPKPKGRQPANGEAKEKKPRGLGIGAFCMDLIKAGKTNDEVLAAVAKKFPDASTKASSVAWYRNKLKQDGAL